MLAPQLPERVADLDDAIRIHEQAISSGTVQLQVGSFPGPAAPLTCSQCVSTNTTWAVVELKELLLSPLDPVETFF